MSDDDARTRRASGSRWRTSGWWYLAFLANLLFQPLFNPDTGAFEWVVVAAAVIVYVPLFLRVVLVGGRLARWAPHLSAAIGLAVFPFNGGATVFMVYAAAFAGAQYSRRVAYRWFVGLSLVTLALAATVPLELPVALMVFALPVVLIWAIGLASLSEAERDRTTTQLRIDNARIEHLAAATERERLARDLHDLLGQSLTEVIVRTQLARRLAPVDLAGAQTELAEIERSSRRALDEVRSVVRGWSEVRLEDELDTARRGLEAAGVTTIVERDPAFDPPPTTETALALALREATTNVTRHARASTCRIELRREGPHDVLQVADDGRGGHFVEGSGLTGMRERVAALGGIVDRRTDAGTSITVRLPTGVPA